LLRINPVTLGKRQEHGPGAIRNSHSDLYGNSPLLYSLWSTPTSMLN